MGFVARLLLSIAAALIAGLVIKSLPDLSRYLKLREM